MPQAPGVPWGVTPEGTRGYAGGSLHLLPELNVKQLLEGPDHLLGLFRARVQHAAELAALEKEHGFYMFQGDLECSDLAFVELQYCAGLIPERHVQEFYIVRGAFAGRCTKQAGVMPPDLLWMFKEGYAIVADVADATLMRQAHMLTTLTVLGDGYRQDVLGKRGSKYTATSHGCAHCAAMGREGGGKLLLCASCGLVAYCSSACQAAHWEGGHKDACCTHPRVVPGMLAKAGARASTHGEGAAGGRPLVGATGGGIRHRSSTSSGEAAGGGNAAASAGLDSSSGTAGGPSARARRLRNRAASRRPCGVDHVAAGSLPSRMHRMTWLVIGAAAFVVACYTLSNLYGN
jgi:hypothetical protein